ncbi:MAG: acyltransferase [Paludisphaera borealis]|uniref:acyltransferase family protein n=1 Tax=Paludisphaera borealis TaxID=1387353 RepID=UPI00283FD679|nr:acyltransferase [Paludisphaera borealis]MDR3619930.1 acyltransferase [Paludisphaera borealis]
MLDGVRGLAILLVLIYHFTMGMTGQGLAARLFFKATSVGWCGVDLFFVLSGFLITGILCDAKGSPHRFRNFYARRALRIFPLYYGVLIGVFAGLPLIATTTGGFDGVEDAYIWLWSYGTNILVALRGEWFPLSHFWTLAVEEHFYIFWPAVVFLCDRKTALWVCLGMTLLALVARVWLVSQGAVLAAYCLTVCRMDALAMGGLVALAARGPRGLGVLAPHARTTLLLGATALSALVGWRFGLAFHDPVIQTVGYLALAVCFAALLALVVAAPASSPLAIVCNLAPLRSLGRYSYGLYVYNSIFILLAEGSSLLPRLVAWSGSMAVGRLLYVALAASSTLAVAWLSWHLLEKPFFKLKRHFPSGSDSSSLHRPDPSARTPGYAPAPLCPLKA